MGWQMDEHLKFRLDCSVSIPPALCFLLEVGHGRTKKVFLDKLDFKFYKSKDLCLLDSLPGTYTDTSTGEINKVC